jgi:hypothetical protein
VSFEVCAYTQAARTFASLQWGAFFLLARMVLRLMSSLIAALHWIPVGSMVGHGTVCVVVTVVCSWGATKQRICASHVLE